MAEVEFFTASAREVSFGICKCVQSGLTSIFVFHSSFLTVKHIDLLVDDGFLCKTKLPANFIVATLITEVLFERFVLLCS